MILRIGLMAGILALGVEGGQDSSPKAETPFFCNLKALTAAERTEHSKLGTRLVASIVRRTESRTAMRLRSMAVACRSRTSRHGQSSSDDAVHSSISISSGAGRTDR